MNHLKYEEKGYTYEINIDTGEITSKTKSKYKTYSPPSIQIEDIGDIKTLLKYCSDVSRTQRGDIAYIVDFMAMGYQLTQTDLIVMRWLVANTHVHSFCICTIKKISDGTGYTLQNVRRSIKNLKSNNLITHIVEIFYTEEGYKESLYRLPPQISFKGSLYKWIAQCNSSVKISSPISE